MTIQSIDTYYHGHLFRSRLEARWATVFDDLGIRWEYEPQGYRVGDQQRPYLPDFLLPDIGWWVEVKGTSEYLDTSLLADAVHPTKGIGADSGSTNLMILGPIPDLQGALPLHFTVSRSAVCEQLHRCGEGCDYPPALYGLAWLFAADDIPHLLAEEQKPDGKTLKSWRRWGAYPIPYGRATQNVPKADLTRALLDRRLKAGPFLDAAYTLGRTARFEHGAGAA